MDERFRQIYAERALMGGIAVGGFNVGGALAKGRRCRKAAVKVGPSGKKRCTKYKTLENSMPKKRTPVKRAPAKKKGRGMSGGCGEMMGYGGISMGGCGEMMGYGGAAKKRASPAKPKVSAAKSNNPWIRYVSCLAKVQGLKYGDALKYYRANKTQLQPEYEWFKENEFKRCPKKKIAERRAYPASAPAKKKSPVKNTLQYEMVEFDPTPVARSRKVKNPQFEFIDIPEEELIAQALGKKVFGKKKAKNPKRYVANTPTARQGYRGEVDYVPRNAFGKASVPKMSFLNNPFNRFANEIMNGATPGFTYTPSKNNQPDEVFQFGYPEENTTTASSTRGMGMRRRPGTMHIR